MYQTPIFVHFDEYSRYTAKIFSRNKFSGNGGHKKRARTAVNYPYLWKQQKRLPIPEGIRSLESVYSISCGKKKGVF